MGSYVFVLWGSNFEEVVASIFVTECREAGLRVKLVGLTPLHISGSHGLVLVPDLTLDQALPLAGDALCVVIPYTAPGLKRLKNDPRITKFFQQAQANQARFVIGPLQEMELANEPLFSGKELIVYPDSEELTPFVRQLAVSLSNAAL